MKDDMPDLPLHLKCRPKSLSGIVGQQAMVDSLSRLLKSDAPPHSYLFTGASGCGKTTLARIVMKHFDCEITEIDAASNSGIDAMKDVANSLRYPGLNKRNRGLIVDEAHGLSKQAWDSLLKLIEEPPSHLYIALCTTVPGKVPDTIASRCQSYNIKPLRKSDLMDLLCKVADEEKMACSDSVLDVVADAADGSARRALVMLASVAHCTITADAKGLLDGVDEDGPPAVIDLARLLVSDRMVWSDVTRTLSAEGLSAESARITLVTYISAVMLKQKEADFRLISCLRYLSKPPFNPTDKMAPLLVALHSCLDLDPDRQ